jgi:serine/threonine-protein kinase HipA
MSNCLGCLKNGIDSYCKKCRKKLFGGADVNPVLSFTRPEYNQLKLTQGEKLSISGVQTKHSLKLTGNKLKLTFRSGQYILKPVPTGPFDNLEYVPQNEHLTMQIAEQVFDIPVMENGLVKFKEGEFAYLTKRFDVISPDKKRQQEDLAQAAGRTEETHGRHYKYDLSYEEAAEVLKSIIGAYLVEVEKFYKMILFNYLFLNGDAHLKNFSIYRDEKFNDYLLAPAYDLLMTRLHVPGDHDTALALMKEDNSSKTVRKTGELKLKTFELFGKRIGINDKRLSRINSAFSGKSDKVKDMVNKSYLSDSLKEQYFSNYSVRMDDVFG